LSANCIALIPIAIEPLFPTFVNKLDSPMAILLLPVQLSASDPIFILILLDPDVLLNKAFWPNATFLFPDVFKYSAPDPTATKLIPLVFALKALKPTAVLAEAVLFNNASLPIAVFMIAPTVEYKAL
jgi:hypothetical protein